jgi:hypothetical protein
VSTSSRQMTASRFVTSGVASPAVLLRLFESRFGNLRLHMQMCKVSHLLLDVALAMMLAFSKS